MRGPSRYAREADEWYVEPPAATRALLASSTYRYSGGGDLDVYWDPCCGQGNIVKTIIAAGRRAQGSDLRARVRKSAWFLGQRDFLTLDPREPLGPVRHIVMNPPFGGGALAERFIRHALAFDVETVAAFVDLTFIAGDARARGFYAQMPPACVVVLHPRVSCPPGRQLEIGRRATGGTTDYCWLVWHRGMAQPPIIEWGATRP